MSRSGYNEDYDDLASLNLYRASVDRATRGKRGQKLLRDMRAALDAMPEKRLIANDIETPAGAVCALGALGKARGLDMSNLDPEDADTVAGTFGIAPSLAREIVYMNDEYGAHVWREGVCTDCHGWGETMEHRHRWGFAFTIEHPARCYPCSGTGRRMHRVRETPEARFARMREWVASQITPASEATP